MKWNENMPLPLRYVVGMAIVMTYVVIEVVEFVRLPRAERERLIDEVLHMLNVDDETKEGERYGS